MNNMEKCFPSCRDCAAMRVAHILTKTQEEQLVIAET
jgi:hypothetical protein